MSDKISTQLKQKYFALYWGQKVLTYQINTDYRREVSEHSIDLIDNKCLLLRSIKNLSVDEKLELLQIERLNYKFIQVNKLNITELRVWIDDNIALIQSEVISNGGIDYLRSLGIALPICDVNTLSMISVEELVEQNVIKLEKND